MARGNRSFCGVDWKILRMLSGKLDFMQPATVFFDGSKMQEASAIFLSSLPSSSA